MDIGFLINGEGIGATGGKTFERRDPVTGNLPDRITDCCLAP